MTEENQTLNKKKNIFMEYVPYLFLGILFALMIRLVISPTVVVGVSMEGSLHDGDYLIVNKLAYKTGEPKHGDVVILDSDDVPGHDIYIKRIVGLPGDTIEVKDGELVRNGKTINEPYAKEKMESENMKMTIPEGEVFVLGDNRNNSTDSRIIGTLDYKEEVIGKAVLRVLPFDQEFKSID